MVSGKTQAVDSAFIKANAAMDSLTERELDKTSKQYYSALTDNEEGKEGKTGKKTKHSERFVSTTDPDARVSTIRKAKNLP